MNKTPRKTILLSRRNLLSSAMCAAGVLPAIAVQSKETFAQAKLPKSAVAYQDHPKGSQDCANCNLFQPPNACKNVAGDISSKAWCNIWVKK